MNAGRVAVTVYRLGDAPLGLGAIEAAARPPEWRRSAECQHAGYVDDRASASRDHAGGRSPRQHGGGDDLDVQELARLVGRQLDERHVVRDAGVVDQHGEFLAGADAGDRFQVGTRPEVRDQGANCDMRECRCQVFEPVAAATHDDEVVPVGAEPSSKGLANAGRCAGDERQSLAASTVDVRHPGRMTGFRHIDSLSMGRRRRHSIVP